MRYLLLFFDDPAELDTVNDADEGRVVLDYRSFTDSIVKTGNFRSWEALEPVTTATTIRVRGGKRMVRDGPAAETTEHLVGCCLIEAKDLDEALGIAERVPSARCGAVEVRPVRRVSEQAGGRP